MGILKRFNFGSDAAKDREERERKKKAPTLADARNIPTLENAGKRSFYEAQREGLQKTLERAEAPYRNPEEEAAVLRAQERTNSIGAGNYAFKGDCGEVGASCGKLMEFGIFACRGGEMKDKRTGEVLARVPPCEFAHERLPILRGLVHVEMTRR